MSLSPDKGGRAVTDLDVGDFLVSQDGEERNLSHFALYTEEVISRTVQASADESSPTQPPGDEDPATERGGSVRAEIKPVYIVLFIDERKPASHGPQPRPGPGSAFSAGRSCIPMST